ncbi:MAG: DUF3084 domain-containing protein [Fimbriimonadales bacterium]
MTLTMFVFVVLMIVMGGAIAYAGDWLGRKVGKQRLSLFGIRPRHTATLITAITGSLIVALTTLGLTVLDESFRVWITRGNLVLAQLRQNEARLQEIQRTNTELVASRKGLEADLKTTRESLETIQREYQVRLQEVQRLEQEVATRTQQLASTRSQIGGLERQLKSLRLVKAQLEQQIASLRQDIAALERLQALIRKQNDEFADENAQLASENAKLEKQNLQLATENKQILERNRTLAEENRLIEEQNRILLSNATEYRRQLEQLQTSVQELVQLANIRLKPIGVQVGEELARLSLPPRLSELRVRQALQDLLNLADQTAKARGASPETGTRAVFIPEKQVRLVSGEQVSVNETESLETILNVVRTSGDGIVLVVRALTNTAAGEPVPVEIHLYRNRKVFSAGEEIARIRLDCRDSSNVLGQVLEFLQTTVRTRAIEAGMVPRQERAGAMPTVGETDTQTLSRLLNEARQCRSDTVLLVVRAERDTYAGDTLQLKFELTPAGRG